MSGDERACAVGDQRGAEKVGGGIFQSDFSFPLSSGISDHLSADERAVPESGPFSGKPCVLCMGRARLHRTDAVLDGFGLCQWPFAGICESSGTGTSCERDSGGIGADKPLAAGRI